MKLNVARKLKQQGFTLIEMIGVLAVIAILAAVLIPKVFEAISNARVNNAAMSIQTVKTAIADHYAKYGSLAVDGRSATPAAFADTNNFDGILLGEGFLDKPFAVKIGDGDAALNNIVVTNGAAAATTLLSAYDLDGDGTMDTTTTSKVVEAHISNTTIEDAQALDRAIDGVSLSYTTAGTPDVRGRVKWAQDATTKLCGIHVYLTHR